MKVSSWLREYQLTGLVPEEPKGQPAVAFWSGWMLQHAHNYLERGGIQIVGHVPPIGSWEPSEKMKPALEMAIAAAEFIESQK